MHNPRSFLFGALLSSAALLAPAVAQNSTSTSTVAIPTATPAPGQTFNSELFAPKATKWPDNRIRYKVTSQSEVWMELQMVRQAMLQWEQRTCIRFQQVGLEETENVYVHTNNQHSP